MTADGNITDSCCRTTRSVTQWWDLISMRSRVLEVLSLKGRGIRKRMNSQRIVSAAISRLRDFASTRRKFQLLQFVQLQLEPKDLWSLPGAYHFTTTRMCCACFPSPVHWTSLIRRDAVNKDGSCMFVRVQSNNKGNNSVTCLHPCSTLRSASWFVSHDSLRFMACSCTTGQCLETLVCPWHGLVRSRLLSRLSARRLPRLSQSLCLSSLSVASVVDPGPMSSRDESSEAPRSSHSVVLEA